MMNEQIVVLGVPKWEDLTAEPKQVIAHICYEALIRSMATETDH